jgi:hypothetical protein
MESHLFNNNNAHPCRIVNTNGTDQPAAQQLKHRCRCLSRLPIHSTNPPEPPGFNNSPRIFFVVKVPGLKTFAVLRIHRHMSYLRHPLEKVVIATWKPLGLFCQLGLHVSRRGKVVHLFLFLFLFLSLFLQGFLPFVLWLNLRCDPVVL